MGRRFVSFLEHIDQLQNTFSHYLVKQINQDHEESCVLNHRDKVFPSFFTSRPSRVFQQDKNIFKKFHNNLLSGFFMNCIFATMFTKLVNF